MNSISFVRRFSKMKRINDLADYYNLPNTENNMNKIFFYQQNDKIYYMIYLYMFEFKKNNVKNPLSDIQKNNIYISLDEASKNGFIKIKDINEIEDLMKNTFWNIKHFDKKLSSLSKLENYYAAKASKEQKRDINDLDFYDDALNEIAEAMAITLFQLFFLKCQPKVTIEFYKRLLIPWLSSVNSYFSTAFYIFYVHY